MFPAWHLWCCCYWRWISGAVATNQVSWCFALIHFDMVSQVCQKVAMAGTPNAHLIAQQHDKLRRRQWSNMSHRGDPAMATLTQLEGEAARFKEESLLQAKTKLDAPAILNVAVDGPTQQPHHVFRGLRMYRLQRLTWSQQCPSQ